MRRLNVRLVVILFASALVLFLVIDGIRLLPGRWQGAWGGLHGYMQWRNADFFVVQAEKALGQAERAEEEGMARDRLAAYEEAVRSYSWYCRLRPEDIDERVKLGLLQENLARVTLATGSKDTLAERQETVAEARRWLAEAVRTLESVLREELGSDRTDARRKLVEVYLNARQYSDAKDHLSALLEKSPDDGEFLELLGTCQAALRETKEASESFERAIESAPERIGAYQRLASLLVDRNRLNRPAEADECMKNMLEANRDSYQAHFAYGAYLWRLAGVNSVDEAKKHPILLDAVVPAVLAQSVEYALESLGLDDDARKSQLLAENKPLLAQAVVEALKLYDPDLELEKPDTLLSEARWGAETEAADPESLKKARDQALKALNLEEGSGDHDAALAAVEHGVLVGGMTRALKILQSPGEITLAAKNALLEEAVEHALTARRLAAPGRDALVSLYLREFSSGDHQAIRLADKHGVLLEATNRALTTLAQNQKTEVSPTALGRTARRKLLLAKVNEVVEGLRLSDENRRALSSRQGMLADLIRHALRDCEASSADRDALLQAGEDGALARVAQEAVADKHGILMEAVKNALQADDAPSRSQVSLSREALTDAIENAKLPKQERDVLLLGAKRGVLVDALTHVLRDPELPSGDRDEILQAGRSGALSRVLTRVLQTRERTLEDDDLQALLLAAQCETGLERTRVKGEFDSARVYADRAIELYPDDPRTYLRAAHIAQQAGKRDEALETLHNGLQATQSPELLSARADFLLETGDLQEVRVCIRALQRFGAADPRLQAQLGYLQARAEYEQGQWLAALKGRKRKLLFTIPNFQGVLDTAIVDTRLRPVFERHQVPLSPNAVKQTESEDKLLIIDQTGVYEVVKQGSTLSIYRGGTRGFEEIRSGLASRPALLKQADFWTGRCYGQLENVDLELKAYQRSLDVDPFYLPAKVGRAAALAKSGRMEEASKEYRQITRLGAAPEVGRLPLAGLLLAKNRRLPPSERDWEELEQVLDDAQEADADPRRLVLLRAELLWTQAAGQKFLSRQLDSLAEQQEASAQAEQLLDQAKELLRRARDADPEHVEFWAALARMAQREAVQQQADKREAAWAQVSGLLDEAEQKLGDSVTLRLARASYLANRYGEEAKDQLRQLAEDTGEFSEAQRLQLWTGLLASAGRVGDNEQFQELCRRVAEKEPSNLRPQRLLLELAFRSGNDAGIKETLENVERIEGQGPLWHYGEAVRLSLLAQAGDDRRSDDALQHLAQARKLRPSWSAIPLAVATVYDQQGNPEAALENFLQAIDMGEYNSAGVRRAVELLFDQQRFSEASRLLSLFPEIPSELLPKAAGIDWELGRFDQALDKARQKASGSDSYRDHLWLGRLLAEQGGRALAEGHTGEAQDIFDEAEEVFRRAVELDDQLPAVWNELIAFLAATGQMQAAEEAIEQARSKIPADQRSLALAEVYERMRQLELAEQSYEKALADAPQDPAVARAVANFYYRKGEHLRSEAILNRIIGGQVKGKQADIVWARRRLAWILLGRLGVGGTYRDLERALKLIEDNLAAAGETTEDLRFKAFILAHDRDPEKRKLATRIIAGLPSRQRTASPDDLFMLWRLYLAEGAWSKASAQMISLLAAHSDRPKYVAAYASALLQRNQPGEAQPWVEHLEKIAPNWFSPRELTTTTSLRAELLFVRAEASLARGEELSKQNRSAEAEAQLGEAKTLLGEVLDLMSRFVGNPNTQPSDEAERSSLVALALERFAQRLTAAGQEEMAAPFVAEAEARYRAYVRRLPSQELLLVGFLGRQGRIGEALERLAYAWEDADPMMIARACTICLESPATTPEQREQVEKVVQAALKKFDRPVLLLLAMAQARAGQGRYAEAERFYREVIERNSENYAARNNLAVLLALQKKKLNEAEDLINQAIELAGPAGSLLDSRASVYMALGQPGKALDDLKRAIDEKATPVRYFHQARAYLQNKQKEAAIEALKDAQKLGLQPEMLEPLERPDYQEMLKELK